MVMTWTQLQAQFRQIAKIFTAIESEVLESGRLDSGVVDRLVDMASVSPLGVKVLTDFLRQSSKIKIQEDAGVVWLVPNHEHIPLDESHLVLA